MGDDRRIGARVANGDKDHFPYIIFHFPFVIVSEGVDPALFQTQCCSYFVYFVNFVDRF